MPGSIFTILSSSQILVDPTNFSHVGTYVIDVSVTDGLSSSGFATFNI
jgi:hypothetical protein